MALLQSIWGKSILIPFPLSFLPPAEDILIVNALKQRVKHSQRQSEVNKNTFYTSTSPPSEAILKIVNNKHSYREYISSISFSGHDSSCLCFFSKK